MKKRFTTTIITLAIFLILAVYANYYETDKILPPGVQKPVEIIKCNENDITALTWKKNGTDKLVVEKSKDSNFKITKPEVFRTEKSEIAGIINKLSSLKSEMVVATDTTKANLFGIATSSPEIVVKTSSSTIELTLGSKIPVGGSYYLVKKGDNRIFTVPSYIQGIFNKKIADVRSKNIFFEDFSGINSLTLLEHGKPIVVEKDKSLKWKILSPEKHDADPQVVSSVIYGIRDIKASEFITDHPGKDHPYGFDDPSLRVVMSDNVGKKYELVVGSKKGNKYYVKRDDENSVYSVAASDVEKYRKTVDDLRVKLLPEFNTTKANKIVVKDATGTIEITKKDGKWLNGSIVVDNAIVTALLDQYSNSRVSKFAHGTEKENKLDNPSKNDKLELSNASGSVSILFGSQKGVEVAIKTNNEIMIIQSDLYSKFKALLDALRPKKDAKKVVVGGSKEVPKNNSDKVASKSMKTGK